jgi:hypothetical protein
MAATERRTCKRHGETTFVLRSDGRWRCRRCAVEYTDRQRRRNHTRLLELAGGCCARCGYMGFAGALQFHHRSRADKRFDLGVSGMGRKWALLVAEVAKCELLCANCHAMLEHERAVSAVVVVTDWSEGLVWCSRHGYRAHIHDGSRRRCITCRSEAVIAHYRRRKDKLIANAGGTCVGCGAAPRPRALQFHHTDPATKRFSLSGPNLLRPWTLVREEAGRCVLLCANCHAEHEWGRRDAV